jgi:acetylornithine deacetylase/succinyl-diaminopimelate desuccinylase-like protein
LVPDQDSDTILRRVKAHVEKHCPKGARVTVRQISSKAEPYQIPFDHPGNQKARSVLKALYGKDPYYARLGGSIPICSLIKKHLDAYTVNFAFGLKDENVHAPNEFFRISSFELGQKAYCMLLNELGG